eukprot:g47998.t1
MNPLQLFENLLMCFWLHFSPMLLTFGHLVWRDVDRSEDLLMCLLLGLARLAINSPAGEGFIAANRIPPFCGSICAWESLQYARESTRRQESRIKELEKEVFNLELCLGQSDVDLALRRVYKEKKAALRVPGHWASGSTDYYVTLFSPGLSSKDFYRVLWADLPQVSPESITMLDTQFVIQIRVLYAAVPYLIKLNKSMMVVLHFWRGVCQGCMEPFLCLYWRRLSGLGLLVGPFNPSSWFCCNNPEDVGSFPLGQEDVLDRSRGSESPLIKEVGVAVTVSEPLLRNPHLHYRGFKCLVEVHSHGDDQSCESQVSGRGLGWMLPQELVNRAVVDNLITANAIHHLKTVVLRHNVMHHLEDAQVCIGILSNGVGKSEDLLLSLLLGLAKSTTNRSKVCSPLEDLECTLVTQPLQRSVEVTKMIDDGKAVDVVYMDFSKDFDKIPNGRLVQKGSVLGPLLFMVYINDLEENMNGLI